MRGEEKQFLQREYDSLHFYDHTSTCIPFVNFLFCSRLKIWGGCSLSKTTCVLLYALQSWGINIFGMYQNNTCTKYLSNKLILFQSETKFLPLLTQGLFEWPTKWYINWKLLLMVEIFYLSDERRKCAENSDIRFYLVKSLLSYQKVKNFGIYLRLEEFNQCQHSITSTSVCFHSSISPQFIWLWQCDMRWVQDLFLHKIA